MQKYYRLAALCGAAAILLTACGFLENIGGANASDVSLAQLSSQDTGTYVYRSAALDLPDELEVVSMAASFDDVLYLYGYSTLPDGSDALSLWKMNTAGEAPARLNYPLSDAYEDYYNYGIADIGVDPSGSLWALESISEESGSHELFLHKFDTNGALSETYSLAEYEAVSSMLIAEESIFLMSDKKLYAVNFQCQAQFDLTLDHSYGDAAVIENILTVGFYIDNAYAIRQLDADARAWGDPYTFDLNCRHFYPGPGNTVLVSDENNLYSLDLDSRETAYVLNWLESGLSSSPLVFRRIGDNRYLYCDVDSQKILSRSDIPSDEMITLTLATMNLSAISASIIAFNQSNENYKIEATDYSVYNATEDDNAGITKLRTEIIAGNIPDILDLYSLPASLYSNDYLLEDLYPYMQNDQEIGASDMNRTVLKAMESDDGRLLSLIPAYGVLTLVCSADTAAAIDQWTVEAYVSLADKTGGNPLGKDLSRYDFIATLASAGFVDWDAGVSDFDSDRFSAVLELAAGLPEEAFDPFSVSVRDLIDSGQQLLSYCFSNIVFGMVSPCLYYGDDVQIIGFPGAESGATLVYPLLHFGMTSSGDSKDGVWEFMRQLLSEDYQISVGGYAYPLLQSALDHWDREAEADIANGGWETHYVDGGQEYTVSIDNTDFVDASHRLLDSVTGVYSHDDAVTQIVCEEAMLFFNGDKTADDVAAIISNRVQTYVGERQ